jgi:hypothetical protein
MKYLTSSILILFSLYSCVESDYTKMVKAELAKGIRMDSILLGINFGDSRNEFYGKCFDLNKKHLVTQGPDGSSVQYIFSDSVKSERQQIKVLFVPSFDEQDILSNLDLKFSYLAWAPWNENLQSDSLEIEVLRLLKNWYRGNDFMLVNVDEELIPIKLDGNRRIMVYKYDTESIVVRVQDILHPKYKHSISAGKGE